MMGKARHVALLSIGVNLFLFGLKYSVALLSGSMALRAEAIHSLTDVIASLTVFAGLIIARRKTPAFPYGLYKVENLVSVIVSLAVFYAAYGILMEAMSGSALELQNVEIAIASMGLAMAITYGFSRYEMRVSRRIASPSLMADARHIRADMLANAVVLAGLLPALWGINIDRIAAIPVVCFVAWSGGKILIDGVRVLLDASLDYPTLSLAEKLIRSEPQVRAVKNLTGRNSGPYKFIEAQIVLKTHDLDKADFIAHRIEDTIKAQIKNVDRVLIHYEPTRQGFHVYALPLTDAHGQSISRHFGEAPFFVLLTVRQHDKTVIDRKVIVNPFTRIEHGKGIHAARWLNEHDIDVIVTRESFEGRGPHYVFSSASVESLLTEADTLPQALASLGLRDEQRA